MDIVEFLNPATMPMPVRTLQEGPDYQPDWRFRTVELYFLELSKAKDAASRIDAILAQERDPYLRQVLKFHTNRRCVIHAAIRYALSCRATNVENRIGSLIRAMTVAGRTPEQIANEFGTEPLNILTYQKLFFDVSRYLDRRGWLKRVCFPIFNHHPTAEEECEGRLLSVAYMRGWPALAGLMSNHKPCQTGKAELSRLVQILLTRSADYFAGLEAAGVLPTERDFQFLVVLQHRIEGLGLPLKLEHLDYVEPLDPDEERLRSEAKERARKCSALSRRRIIAFIERLQTQANLAATGKDSPPDEDGQSTR
jgi:hypothetical protein